MYDKSFIQSGNSPAPNATSTTAPRALTTSMSLSWTSWKPRINDPSKPIPSLIASASTALGGTEKCCQVQGRSVAVRSFATYKDRLARSLAALANDVIVLGGGISNINSLYDELPELIGRHALSDGIRTRVVRAAHGNSSGVRGAAWLRAIDKTQKMVIHTRRLSGSRSTLKNLLPRLRAAANSSSAPGSPSLAEGLFWPRCWSVQSGPISGSWQRRSRCCSAALLYGVQTVVPQKRRRRS